MEQGDMNRALRRIAVVMGVILLLISIHWSQDGFNFSVAGDSGGTLSAIVFAYAIAVAVTVIQFVFSTNLRELNPSLIVFGLLAYAYSIFTNYQGIIHYQGNEPSHVMAAILGFAMDGVPEPLIAWGLMESLSGDFVGNLFGGIGAFVSGKPLGGKKQQNQSNQSNQQKGQQQQHQKGGEERRQGQQFPNKEQRREDVMAKLRQSHQNQPQFRENRENQPIIRNNGENHGNHGNHRNDKH